MIELEKLSVERIGVIALYLLKNQNNIENVIAEFGNVFINNGFGTLFLTPKHAIFKVFWLFLNEDRLETVGFGGRDLGLTFEDLFATYKYCNEGFNIYDDEYEYVFFDSKDYEYTLKIKSKISLVENGKLVNNIDVNGIEMRLGVISSSRSN